LLILTRAKSEIFVVSSNFSEQKTDKLKTIFSFLMAAAIFIFAAPTSSAQKAMKPEDFTMQISKGIPEGFELDESGTDKECLFALYKKSLR
jgi:hypothetical protein